MGGMKKMAVEANSYVFNMDSLANNQIADWERNQNESKIG